MDFLWVQNPDSEINRIMKFLPAKSTCFRTNKVSNLTSDFSKPKSQTAILVVYILDIRQQYIGFAIMKIFLYPTHHRMIAASEGT